MIGLIEWAIGVIIMFAGLHRLSQGSDTEAIILTMIGLYFFQLNNIRSVRGRKENQQ